MTTRLFEIGKQYKFRVLDPDFKNVSIYTGEVTSCTDTHVRIKDLKNKDVILALEHIKRGTEIRE